MKRISGENKLTRHYLEYIKEMKEWPAKKIL